MMELGEEPALYNKQVKKRPPDKRHVSKRWLFCLCVAALTTTCLMGGALYASVNGHTSFAQKPGTNRITLSLKTDDDGAIIKSDRMQRILEPLANRQTMSVSTVKRIGDMRHIQERPYVRIIADLALEVEHHGNDIPAFDAANLYSADATPVQRQGSDALYGADVKGEVALSQNEFDPSQATFMRDLTTLKNMALFRARTLQMLDYNEQDGSSPSNPDRLYNLQARFAAHDNNMNDRFDNVRDALQAYGVKIVAENVTVLGKTHQQNTWLNGVRDHIQPARDEETIETVFHELNLEETNLEPLLNALTQIYEETSFQKGQHIRLGLAKGSTAENKDKLVRFSLYEKREHLFTLSEHQDGSFIRTDEPSTLSAAAFDSLTRQSTAQTTTIYRALYETALSHGVPLDMAHDLIRIYAFDTDFQKRVSPGDRLEILYAPPLDGEGDDMGEILFTNLIVSGSEKRFYRFHNEEGVDYFDAEGKSARKFLLRKPVTAGRFTSGFGPRRHPILKYRRMHNGVDWAAPTGTPIMAAGNGTVIEAKWHSGYGRFTKIRHANGYVTHYAHQSRFAKGLKVGQKVRLGQIIGYVGSTGLSTGPHLHYEVVVNGRHVNPMRIRLPRGDILSGEQLEAFNREKKRVDALMLKDRDPTIRVATR
jgi:murein DD-endopeptidase MepM/ murein hydrolase activator NlpD